MDVPSAINGDGLGKPARWPTSAAPRELKWWNRVSVLWLVSLVLLGALTTNLRVGGLLLLLGGLAQIAFSTVVLVNRRGLADRLAEYYAHRPLMLGGFFLNRVAMLWRLQGGAMLLAGVVLAVLGTALMLR